MTRARQLGAFLLLGLIWGSEWLVQQAIDAPPLRALAIRYAIAAILLSGIVAARGVRPPRGHSLLAAATAGVALLALPPILTLWASQQISSGLLVVLLSLTPLMAAFFEGRVSGWLTPLIGGVGGTALILSSALSFDFTQWAAVLAVLTSAVFIAGSYVYARRKLLEMNPLSISAIQFAAGFATLGCASLLIEGRSDWLWTKEALIWEAGLAFLANAVAFPFYYSLLKRFESFQLTSVQWLVTAVSIAEGMMLTRQRPTWEMLVGAAVVAASVWSLFATRPENEEPLTIRVTRPPFAG